MGDRTSGRIPTHLPHEDDVFNAGFLVPPPAKCLRSTCHPVVRVELLFHWDRSLRKNLAWFLILISLSRPCDASTLTLLSRSIVQFYWCVGRAGFQNP